MEEDDAGRGDARDGCVGGCCCCCFSCRAESDGFGEEVAKDEQKTFIF